jgi:hypothetical protein
MPRLAESTVRRTIQTAASDAGSTVLMWAVLGAVLIAFAAFVADAGQDMHANSSADDLASEAARAAGQQIDAPQAIPGTAIVLDTTAARRAALDYLAQAGASGTVTFTDNDTTVHVTVHAVYKTLFLGAAGYPSLPVTGHGTAHLVTHAGG